MTKILVIPLLLLAVGCASGGKFLNQGMYVETPLVIGQGTSIDIAKSNAMSAIPLGYEPANETASGESGCTNPEEFMVWSDKAQDTVCLSSKYYTIIPLLPKDPAKRQSFLDLKKNKYGEEFVGTGSTLKEAMGDLKQKLPKLSVLDGWVSGCTKKISLDPKSREPYCDSKIEGNMREVRARVLRPNVADFL